MPSDNESAAITHPEKVLFPDDGITKREVADYYARVAAVMLPHIRDRPVTMERFPAGIAAKGFIQKDVSKGFPAWLERVEVPRRDERTGGLVHYPLASDARSLVWMANQNSITPHVWTSRLPRLEQPDLCVFDLDPPELDRPAEGAAALSDAAARVRELLAELDLPAFVKTSGSKGFHIVVPLDDSTDFDTVLRFARGAGAVLVKRHPELFTQEFIKSDRAGRIFVDTGRNVPGATFAATYALRAKPGAPVSAPCTWDEIARGTATPRAFTLKTMEARLQGVGDLWSAITEQAQSLVAPLARLDQLLTPGDWEEAAAASTRRPVSRKGRSKTGASAGSKRRAPVSGTRR